MSSASFSSSLLSLVMAQILYQTGFEKTTKLNLTLLTSVFEKVLHLLATKSIGKTTI